jgi:uncharacterized protein YukE
MADQVVEMDYDEIKKVADNFKDDAEKSRMIAKILEKVVQALKASFVAQLFLQQLIRWLEGIQKALENLAAVQEEFNEDLLFAIKKHQEGDYAGMSRFGEGVTG